MKLITAFELAAKRESELYALLREVFNALSRSETDSHERRNSLASLENIERGSIAIPSLCLYFKITKGWHSIRLFLNYGSRTQHRGFIE